MFAEILGLVEKVVGKVLPNSMDKAEAELIIQKAKSEAAQMVMDEKGQFYKFMTDYEGAAKDLQPFMASYRASVRPTLTYLIIGAVIWCVFRGQAVPMTLNALALLMSSFWFGERAVSNVLPHLADLKKIASGGNGK